MAYEYTVFSNRGDFITAVAGDIITAGTIVFYKGAQGGLPVVGQPPSTGDNYRLGVVEQDAKTGDLVSIRRTGVVALKKKSAEVFAGGNRVFWDEGSRAAINLKDSNPISANNRDTIVFNTNPVAGQPVRIKTAIGVALEDSPAAEDTVKVLLTLD